MSRVDWLTCSRCGKNDTHISMRDASFRDPANPPPRNAYGSWRVCNRCENEWPQPGWSLFGRAE